MQAERRNRSASDSVVHERRHLHELSDHIEISVVLRNLIGVPPNSRFVCILYENDTEDEKSWKVHSSSESQNQGECIEFQAAFVIDYIFEKAQLIKIEVRSYTSRSAFPAIAEGVIGSAIFKLHELIGAFGAQLCKPLSQKTTISSALASHSFPPHPLDYKGLAIIQGRLAEKAEPVFLQFAGKNLEKKAKFFDETKVYFQIHRIEKSDERTLLYESETNKSHSHPVWKPFSLQMKTIADNRNRLMEVTVLYRDEVDKQGYIGTFLTSYAKMKYGPGPENVYNVVNNKKQTKKGYLNSGTFELTKFTDVSFYSFLDYITSGTQLHLAVAADFSLSEADDGRLFSEDLQLSLRSIGNVICDYSPGRLFAAYGFGGKIPPNFHISQMFNMTLDSDPYCRGIDSVVDAYRKASKQVIPADYACYSHLIYDIAKIANNEGSKGLHYFILTIFTRGGPIHDLKDTQSALVHSSTAPLSIIFIGVGNGNFEDFDRLARSGKHLTASGRHSQRDIVEFIELNSVIDRAGSAGDNKNHIAEQALHLIPRQLTDFMHKKNIAAKPPIQISRSPIFHASYLIPDRPTEYYDYEEYVEEEDGSPLRARGVSPRARPQSDRRPGFQYQGGRPAKSKQRVSPTTSSTPRSLTVRATPHAYRSRSAIQTTREQVQKRYGRGGESGEPGDRIALLKSQAKLRPVNSLRINSRGTRLPSNIG